MKVYFQQIILAAQPMSFETENKSLFCKHVEDAETTYFPLLLKQMLVISAKWSIVNSINSILTIINSNNFIITY